MLEREGVVRRIERAMGRLLSGHPGLAVAGFASAFLGLVALTLLVGPWVARGPVDPPADEAATAAEPVEHPLTGVLVDAVPPRPALLVKVSNSPEARPQTGLDRADVVFEELTEGGVTRFVAVFHSQVPAVVGPVRSARPVDVQVVSGFGSPGFAFSGARPEVRAAVGAAPLVPLTEGTPGFFRDDGRYASHPFAPHDLFVDVATALAEVTDRGARPFTDVGWRFDDEPPAGGGPASEVEVPMSPSSVTGWRYEEDAGHYRRVQNGEASTVTGSGRIGAANVVVLDVRHDIGASGYPETDVLGTGAALVLRDGRAYDARWDKPSEQSPLRVLDGSGAPFPFARGPTWILLPDRLPTP